MCQTDPNERRPFARPSLGRNQWGRRYERMREDCRERIALGQQKTGYHAMRLFCEVFGKLNKVSFFLQIGAYEAVGKCKTFA